MGAERFRQRDGSVSYDGRKMCMDGVEKWTGGQGDECIQDLVHCFAAVFFLWSLMKKKANGCSLDASNHLPCASLPFLHAYFLRLPFIHTYFPSARSLSPAAFPFQHLEVHWVHIIFSSTVKESEQNYRKKTSQTRHEYVRSKIFCKQTSF